MPINKATDIDTFKEFLAKLIERRATVRLVRLTDYGFVEPAKRNNAFVMQPRVRVVATAFDRSTGEILRYQEKKDADQMVTVVAGRGKGHHNDYDMVARKDELKALLLDEGFQVEEGEWTPESAEAFLEVRKQALG